MRILRVLALALSMLVMNLVGVSPAQAVADGTVNCGTSGTFTIVSNIVTTNTNCRGSLSIPEGVTEIANDAFNLAPDRSSFITSIIFPNSLTIIKESAFRAASTLTSIDFGTGIQSIVHWNFADSTSLTSVTIPSSVTSIGVGVFYGSTQLESVTFLGNAPSVNSNAFNGLKAGAVANVTSGATGFGANGSTWKYLRVSVAPAAPAFTLSSSSETLMVNTAATGFTINSTGGTIASFSISPSAPAGMSFNTTTGAFTGTPTSVASATPYVITATNASGSATATFTLTVSAAVVVDNSAAQAAAAGAKREVEKQTARIEISKGFSESKGPTIQQFATAEISGVTEKNLPMISNELMAMTPVDRSDIKMVEKVSKKYRILDEISKGDKFTTITAKDLSAVGLIPVKNENSITNALRQLPASQRDDYAKITAAISDELAIIRIREERLASIIALRKSRQVA